MKRILSVTLACTLASGLAGAENFTQVNTDKAREIIAAAVEAHGGSALIDDLQTLIIEHETVTYAVDQSRAAEPPWDKNKDVGIDALDIDASVFVTTSENNGGGFEARNATIINGDESYQLDYRAGTAAKIAEPDFATTSGPFVRVTPGLLIRTLNDRAANAYYLGDTEVDGVSYDVVGFSMTVGPAISLYFHKKTHLLHRSERVFPGFGLVEYEFNDYKVADGIPFNQTFNLFLNGYPNLERKNVAMKINKPLGDLATVEPTLMSVAEVQPDPLSRQEIADGVWLIGGNGTYVMFVDMGDYIFAAGGTAGIPERIDSLREVVADKPIRYGMMTHHHFDHVLGVPAYEAEGATVIAATAHEAVVRRAAANADSLNVETIDDRKVLQTDTRRLEIIDIGPTAHTEHLLVAYLPEAGILFEADHFALPAEGPVPPAVSSTKTFATALTRQELDVSKFLSAHSARVGGMDDLRAALEAKLYQAER